MILTIISILILIIGIILIIKYYDIYEEGLTISAILITILGAGGLLGCLLLILSSHTRVDYKIESTNINYNTLCKKIELINSDYEDVSKIDVIDDIGSWNKWVHRQKHVSNSHWTNWFYSKKYVDSLKYIDINLIK